jgi:hypothetical protein
MRQPLSTNVCLFKFCIAFPVLCVRFRFLDTGHKPRNEIGTQVTAGIPIGSRNSPIYVRSWYDVIADVIAVALLVPMSM